MADETRLSRRATIENNLRTALRGLRTEHGDRLRESDVDDLYEALMELIEFKASMAR